MEQTFRILSDILNGSIGCSSADQSCSFFKELSDQISELSNTWDSCRLSCEQEKRHMAELHQKKMKLQGLVVYQM